MLIHMMYHGSRWSNELWIIRKWNSACKIGLQHFPVGLKHWCWKPAARIRYRKDPRLGLAGIGLQCCAHTQRKDPCVILGGQQLNRSLSQEETIYSGGKCQTLASVLAVTAWLGKGKVFRGTPCPGSVVGITWWVTGTLMQCVTESEPGLAEAPDERMRRWA